MAAILHAGDARGWLMTALSGLACVVGASIICVDLVAAPLFRLRKFTIIKSNGFLSGSLSLTFGVLLFSSLYTILPSAPVEIAQAGFSAGAARWITFGCFTAGALTILVFSHLIHHHMPTHVVDCQHTHPASPPGESAADLEAGCLAAMQPVPAVFVTEPAREAHKHHQHDAHAHDHDHDHDHAMDRTAQARSVAAQKATGRPSAIPLLPGAISELVFPAVVDECGTTGECYGYTGECGSRCFRTLEATPVTLLRPATETTPLLGRPGQQVAPAGRDEPEASDPDGNNSNSQNSYHHHHVPTNAFFSAGVQTSIAIALHKLPEGFITYASNHASPQLGLSVFLSLFIHNVTEGFAMALPLYLATKSRPRAILVSSVLGGVSQPAGALVAALWLNVCQGGEPSRVVYGVMFALTAGVMTAVALRLFADSLELSHNPNLCFTFAIIGMGLVGATSALTA